MKKILIYFGLAYLITWVIWLPLVLPKFGIEGLPVITRYHHYLGSFGPMIAAFLVTYFYDGMAGIKNLLARMVAWKVPFTWWMIVLVVPVLMVILSGYIGKAVQGSEFSMNGFSTNEEFPQFGPVAYFLFNFLTFGIGEETGWRGFALPHLQKKWNALASTLFLTVGWACWHIPAFFYRSLYSQMDVAGIAGFFFSMLMGSVILTWLYNSTRGSILIVSVFHAMVELMFMSANITPAISTYLGIIMMVAVVLIILIAKPKNLAGVERQTV